MYIDSYKAINGKNEEDTNKWTDISHLWVQRNNIVKMSVLSKQYTDSIESVSRIPLKDEWIKNRTHRHTYT